MITHLEVWFSVIFVSRILLDLLAVFNILLNCLLYIFHFLYYSLGIFLANLSILRQDVVNKIPIKESL